MGTLDLQITDLVRELILTTLMLAGPVLGIGLVVGLSVSIFQALTSVQEQTLSLIPKMFAVMVVVLVLLAPALHILREYTARVLEQIATFGVS